MTIPGEDLLLVGVLRGAFMVMADLARHIDLPVEFDFMAVSSYGASTQTSGVVRILKDLDEEIEGRHVLIVEDIIDSGLDAELPDEESQCPQTGLTGGGHPAPEGGDPEGSDRCEVRRVPHRARVRRRVRIGLRRASTAISPMSGSWAANEQGFDYSGRSRNIEGSRAPILKLRSL